MTIMNNLVKHPCEIMSYLSLPGQVGPGFKVASKRARFPHLNQHAQNRACPGRSSPDAAQELQRRAGRARGALSEVLQ